MNRTALVSLALLLLPVASADWGTLSYLTGAGPAWKVNGECASQGVIVVHIDLNGIGTLAFPDTIIGGCGGLANAFVGDCQRDGDLIACAGSNPADARFTLRDDGFADYVTPTQNATFHVHALVAYQLVVVP